MDIYSTINLHGLQWDRLTLHRLQGNLLEIPGAPPPAPSSLTLVPAKLFLLHSLTLSDCNCFCATFSFLKSVIPGMLPPPLVGSALACSGSILLPAGIGSDRYEGNFWHLLTEVSPGAPSTKALLHNPNTGTALNFTTFSVARVIPGLMWMQAAFYTRQNLTQKPCHTAETQQQAQIALSEQNCLCIFLHTVALWHMSKNWRSYNENLIRASLKWCLLFPRPSNLSGSQWLCSSAWLLLSSILRTIYSMM